MSNSQNIGVLLMWHWKLHRLHAWRPEVQGQTMTCLSEGRTAAIDMIEASPAHTARVRKSTRARAHRMWS